ncbi:MAG: lysine--tRNA ligase, partial [Candidatus Norongarragalinales archaeon]
MHWADQLAEKIIERAKREGRTPNVKCQQTPSGGKHIGNLNDVLRAWFPVKAVRQKGVECEFVHTTDDRDPLKDVPLKLMDLNGKWHSSTEFPRIKEFLGMPLCRIPDPFGCCDSWSEHFTEVWMRGVFDLDVHPTLYSVNRLYEEGRMEPFIRTVFEKSAEVGKIVARFQATKKEDYIPFDAICPQCGRLANVDSFDLQNRLVHFTCGGKAIKSRKSEGCGFEGEVPWSEGKLQWRFEWPALMCLFNTTFEPFGKDHFEGSWKSVLEIMPKIFGREPPIPFVYEFFLVNGEKMSASKGNVFVVQDILQIVEPEVFRFFYAMRPEKQRDLELSRIFQLVDEFDECERIYFGVSSARSENREENYKRMYELAMNSVPSKAPVRVSYSFAAFLTQLMDDDAVVKKLVELGHLKKASDEDLAAARKRVRLARNWVALYAAPESKLSLLEASESLAKFALLPENAKRVLQEFAVAYGKPGVSEQELAAEAKRLCAEHSLQSVDFFKAAYSVLFGRE